MHFHKKFAYIVFFVLCQSLFKKKLDSKIICLVAKKNFINKSLIFENHHVLDQNFLYFYNETYPDHSVAFSWGDRFHRGLNH